MDVADTVATKADREGCAEGHLDVRGSPIIRQPLCYSRMRHSDLCYVLPVEFNVIVIRGENMSLTARTATMHSVNRAISTHLGSFKRSGPHYPMDPHDQLLRDIVLVAGTSTHVVTCIILTA